ncbi:hypothetical protein [Prescottella agglutinans]|nr:hypothetical protein [Prescottella agglutinans]
MRAALGGASSQEAAALAKTAALSVASGAPGTAPDNVEASNEDSGASTTSRGMVRDDEDRQKIDRPRSTTGKTRRLTDAGSPDATSVNLVGHAQRVQQRSQLAEGSTINVVNFVLVPPAGSPTGVTMRGSLLSGVIQDGDEVVVMESTREGNTVLASRVLNRTTQTEVRVEALDPWKKFQLSGMSKSKTGKALLLIAALIAVIIVSIWIFIAFSMFTDSGSGRSSSFPGSRSHVEFDIGPT